jgi:uncharacterized protein (DUF2225 family)
MNTPGLYLTHINVKCPRCGTVFNTTQLPVLLDTGYRNSELRQDLKGALPPLEQYAVHTCPSCNHAGWSNSFTEVEEQTTLTEAAEIKHLQFRSAAIAAEREGRDFYTVGLFFLHAAWCADDSNARTQSAEYRRLTADAFKKSLTDGSCPLNQRSEIQYLIGELLRRAGDFEASREHFKQVLPQLPGRFALMSRKLIRLAEMNNQDAIDFAAEATA